MFRVSQRADDQSVLNLSTRDPIAWVDAEQYGIELAAGRVRREWTWLAFVDDDPDARPVARAIWWGPVASVHPVELRCLIVAPSLPHPELWGAAIIRSAHRSFAAAGALFVPEFIVSVDPAGRGDAATERAVAWRREAARQAGVSLVVREARPVASAADRSSFAAL
ncbi:hypothetical protein [Subtercola endophyticus]|uniref:hypothetical protein n=1 Tax=Subtercola endophyticus TaxID=2895559 RepID=UPI001E59033B|nr:hypothetical protein [Subtercola endophyticus]UFS59603.1 hypothetical protein LQ955_02030 [Subtercola endophyticus]